MQLKKYLYLLYFLPFLFEGRIVGGQKEKLAAIEQTTSKKKEKAKPYSWRPVGTLVANGAYLAALFFFGQDESLNLSMVLGIGVLLFVVSGFLGELAGFDWAGRYQKMILIFLMPYRSDYVFKKEKPSVWWLTVGLAPFYVAGVLFLGFGCLFGLYLHIFNSEKNQSFIQKVMMVLTCVAGLPAFLYRIPRGFIWGYDFMPSSSSPSVAKPSAEEATDTELSIFKAEI